MTNAQIQSFMAVVQYQSFSRAAEHLFISQSAVSKNVAQLERDLGYVLIDRTYGSVRTTEVGRRFYEFFCDSEHRFDALREELGPLRVLPRAPAHVPRALPQHPPAARRL